MSYVSVVAFDCETTGLNPAECEIIEIAGNRFTFAPSEDGNFVSVEINSFQSLIKPKKSIPGFITEINNISNSMVADAPELKPVLADFLRFCGPSSILVAHNASFDTGFLGPAIRVSGLPMALNPVFCSLKIARKIMPEYRSHKLVALAEKMAGQGGFVLDKTRLHRAEYDTIVLREVFCACLRKRYQCKDLLQDQAVKKLTQVHGKPLFFPDFA